MNFELNSRFRHLNEVLVSFEGEGSGTLSLTDPVTARP